MLLLGMTVAAQTNSTHARHPLLKREQPFNIESKLGGIEWRKQLRIGSFAMGDTVFTRSGH